MVVPRKAGREGEEEEEEEEAMLLISDALLIPLRVFLGLGGLGDAPGSPEAQE